MVQHVEVVRRPTRKGVAGLEQHEWSSKDKKEISGEMGKANRLSGYKEGGGEPKGRVGVWGKIRLPNWSRLEGADKRKLYS